MANKRRILFTVLTMMACSAVCAEPDTIPNADESIARNQQLQVAKNMDLAYNENVYEIRREASRMEFHVDSPVGDIWASFRNFEGSFVLQNSGVRDNSLSIDIDVASMDTDTCLVGSMLKGENFFDVEKYPFVHFVGTSFEWINGREAVLKGNLTIKGITRQIAFYVELPDKSSEYSGRITLKASTTIRRSEFGIDTLLPSVSDNVNLYISIEAQQRNTAISML